MVTLHTITLLFDFDGTLVDSTSAVEKSWATELVHHNSTYPDKQYTHEEFFQSSHGTRTVEVFSRFFPYKSGDDASINAWEYGIVSNYGHLGKEINGATSLLNSLNKEVRDNWAIVTSGTRNLAHGWFDKLFSSVEKPTVFITANDVEKGKPDPQGYATAYKNLNKTGECDNQALVFEDAPVGIQSGLNAGFKVVGIASTFSSEILKKAGASYVVKDMSKVKVKGDGKGGVLLELDETSV